MFSIVKVEHHISWTRFERINPNLLTLHVSMLILEPAPVVKFVRISEKIQQCVPTKTVLNSSNSCSIYSYSYGH